MQVAKHKPINLGQGFPDILPIGHVLKSLHAVSEADTNPLYHQYTRSMGHPRLVNVLGKLYSPFTQCDPDLYEKAGELTVDTFAPDRQIDPMSEITVSVGAYGCLSAAISSLIDHGDEVIIMDPSFDCYTPMTELVGGVPVYVPLKPSKQSISSGDQLNSDGWRLDPDELKSKITSKTKMIILNTPHNPLGKVFDLDELQLIADICIKHNLVCLSDEVYEWIVYEPKRHIKIASLPGMWNRTLTVGSAGKTFSVTGWKLGWTVGPSDLIRAMQLHQQNTIYTCPTPIQESVANSLEIELPLLGTPTSYFKELSKTVTEKGVDMVNTLNELGMRVVMPTGGYFLFADVSQLRVPAGEMSDDPSLAFDVRFNNWMMQKKGICGIPMSVFYSEGNRHLGEKCIRFCFFKADSTLQKAYTVFKRW